METETRDAVDLSVVVGKEIRILLLRLDMKQTELAARLGVNEMWLSRRLRGAQEIGLNDLQRIAGALGVEAATLFPGTDSGRTNGHPISRRSRRPEKTGPNGHPKRTLPHPPTHRPARNPVAVKALTSHADDAPASAGR